MAHFAELDENNVVLRVITVDNNISTAAGPLGENDMHVDGETWCTNLLGGTWKQASYNSNFRKQYCGTGFTYDSEKNKFISPKPHVSWTLDANGDWQAPVTYPTITEYESSGVSLNYVIKWDETNQKWTATDKELPRNNLDWDSSALVWTVV
jgi:hypothetical protein|tara:strand:+ start:1009 stop:1464 length:456 start_codon:yes stop_codon:yes gene_type:complete